jgi:hypothetical protein
MVRARWPCIGRGKAGASALSIPPIWKASQEPPDREPWSTRRRSSRGGRVQLDNLLDEAARSNLSARETLTMLCEREIARKDHRRIEMALKLAHFPAVKELAGFDFEAQPSIDPKQVRDLTASRWIANGENVLLLGPPGVGKTHLAIAPSGRLRLPPPRHRRNPPPTPIMNPTVGAVLHGAKGAVPDGV